MHAKKVCIRTLHVSRTSAALSPRGTLLEQAPRGAPWRPCKNGSAEPVPVFLVAQGWATEPQGCCRSWERLRGAFTKTCSPSCLGRKPQNGVLEELSIAEIFCSVVAPLSCLYWQVSSVLACNMCVLLTLCAVHHEPARCHIALRSM